MFKFSNRPLSNRLNINFAAIAGVLLATIFGFNTSQADMPDSKGAGNQPNVLFIAVDDLNDWIGCLEGHPQALTPNMDRLAARGVLFTNAHCASPACNPSRAAVFSGLRPRNTGVWSNGSSSLGKLQPDALLLTQAFAKAGYQTLGTGKLLHQKKSSPVDEYFGVEQRWSPLTKADVEYTDEELPSKKTDNPVHTVKDSQGQTVVLPLNRMPSDRRPDQNDGESFDWGPFDVPDSDFGDTQITDWAIEKLKTKSDKPKFLAVGYYRPHIPLWAPKRFFDRFENDPGRRPPFLKGDLDDLSSTGKDLAIEAVTAGSHLTVVKHKQWSAAIEGYLACVTYVDHEIGRLLDALDQSKLNENTVVVLWSDHGWHLGEKQHWGKWTGWERSTRVPMIIVPPKSMTKQFPNAGAECDQPVSLLDLYPTLIEMCGVEGPKQLDGQSLLPTLKDPAASTERAVITSFGAGNSTLRTNQWRLIRYADGEEELYDLKNDPNEWNNLSRSDEHAEVRSKLSERLAQSCVEPSQGEWYTKYKKQENAPKPDTMRLNTSKEPGLKKGFRPLFNESDLAGWTPKGGTCTFEAKDNCIIGTCVPGSNSTYLCTDAEFDDFVFTCEMKWDVDCNSGVMFRSATKPGKGDAVTVFGPQAEMEGFSRDRGWSGGVYGQSCGGFFYPLWLKGHADARKALKEGKWNRLTVQAKDNAVKTWVNGVPCAHWIDDGTYTKGVFGLQIHKGKEGTVRWRNLQVKEL